MELAPIYSNRSASFLKLSKVTQALTDAEKCVELKPDWDKAHFRKAAALEAGEDDDGALKALEVRTVLGSACTDVLPLSSVLRAPASRSCVPPSLDTIVRMKALTPTV